MVGPEFFSFLSILRISLPLAVRNTYELRRLEYVLATWLITLESVICVGNLRNWNCGFFYFGSCEVGKKMILRNEREKKR